jgi:RNA recognition motif-containing protein
LAPEKFIDGTVFLLLLGRGGFGFQRSNDGDDEIEVLKDAIFIQNLPRNITRDDIQDAFSTVGPIKVPEQIHFLLRTKQKASF